MTGRKSYTNLERENRELRATVERQERILASLTPSAGPIKLDRVARTVTVDDVPVSLVPHAYRLLELLLLRKGQVLTSEELRTLLWGPDEDPPTSSLPVVVHRLREALGAAGALVEVVRGIGYTIREEI